MTRVVDAWDEGYRAGVHDATHPASSPTINPYQRSGVDADHVIAEAARTWWRARLTARAETDRLLDDDGLTQTRQVNQSIDAEVWAQWRLSEALDAEAAWLSRQPGQGAIS